MRKLYYNQMTSTQCAGSLPGARTRQTYKAHANSLHWWVHKCNFYQIFEQLYLFTTSKEVSSQGLYRESCSDPKKKMIKIKP